MTSSYNLLGSNNGVKWQGFACLLWALPLVFMGWGLGGGGGGMGQQMYNSPLPMLQRKLTKYMKLCRQQGVNIWIQVVSSGVMKNQERSCYLLHIQTADKVNSIQRFVYFRAVYTLLL
jgi:hypothetical protein